MWKFETLMLFVGFLIGLCLYALNSSLAKGTERRTKDRGVFPGYKSSRPKIDCDAVTVYATLDEQCGELCSGRFVQRHGICVNSLALNYKPTENKCSPKDGLIAFLTGDPQFGNVSMLCLSVDPGVRPDDIRLPNEICVNGTVDVNYLIDFPQVKNCKCSEGEFAIATLNTSVVRTKATCVKDGLKKIAVFNNLTLEQ